MDKATEQQVRARANERCEFCHMPATTPDIQFHFDHVVARQHGGPTVLGNLAWCCSHCNLHKGPNLSGIDPISKNIVPLFHPRLQSWDEHFVWDGARIIGVTPEGRTTVEVLQMNAPDVVYLRLELLEQGLLHPRQG